MPKKNKPQLIDYFNKKDPGRIYDSRFDSCTPSYVFIIEIETDKEEIDKLVDYYNYPKCDFIILKITWLGNSDYGDMHAFCSTYREIDLFIKECLNSQVEQKYDEYIIEDDDESETE